MEGSVDPRHLVVGALQASLTLFGAQTAASILLANGQGTAVDVHFAGGLIPFLGIRTAPADVVPLMSWSVALAVGLTVTAALWNLWRRRDNPSLVLGWASGLAMSTVLIAMHWVRHLMDPPLVNLWVLSQAFAYVVAASCLFIAFRPSLTSPTEKRS
jgi:hypothetical protein